MIYPVFLLCFCAVTVLLKIQWPVLIHDGESYIMSINNTMHEDDIFALMHTYTTERFCCSIGRMFSTVIDLTTLYKFQLRV
jgi:hypothetical protein